MVQRAAAERGKEHYPAVRRFAQEVALSYDEAPSHGPENFPQVIANEPELRRIQISAMVCKSFKALDSAAGLSESDPAWLWKLKIKGKCALDEEEVSGAFMEAAKGDSKDEIFKKAVAARSTPLSDADIKSRINKVEWLLLEHWLAVETNAPFSKSLCYYNDKALAKLVPHTWTARDRSSTTNKV